MYKKAENNIGSSSGYLQAGKADESRRNSAFVKQHERELRAQKALKNLENFKPEAEKAIARAEKKGLHSITTWRLKLIREIEGDVPRITLLIFPCCRLCEGRKVHNETEEELLRREKEIFDEFRIDGYKVVIDGAEIIISW